MADAFEPCYTLELTVKEGKDEEFLAIFKDNLEKSRAEPGVLQYDLLKDMKKPNTYNLWQRYKSVEAVKEHMATEHVKEMFTLLPSILAAPFVQSDYKSAY